MNYKKIMCKFCKECIGMKLNKYVIKTQDVRNSNTVVTKCENFYPKYEFESEEL